MKLWQTPILWMLIGNVLIQLGYEEKGHDFIVAGFWMAGAVVAMYALALAWELWYERHPV